MVFKNFFCNLVDGGPIVFKWTDFDFSINTLTIVINMKQKAFYVLEITLYWQVIHSEAFDVLLNSPIDTMGIWILEILPSGCGDINIKYYAKYGILLPNH